MKDSEQKKDQSKPKPSEETLADVIRSLGSSDGTFEIQPGGVTVSKVDRRVLFRRFVERIQIGDISAIDDIRRRSEVNTPLMRSGLTALHVAAASRARDVIRALLASGDCDVLALDGRGRRASEFAYRYGHDVPLARYLRILERKEAAKRGMTLSRPIDR